MNYRYVIHTAVLLCSLVTLPATAGPNESASLSVDLDLTTPGIQSQHIIDEEVSQFFAAVWCEDVENLDTYSFLLTFDTSLVELTGTYEENPMAGLTNILKSNGGATLFMEPSTEEKQAGKITVASTLTESNPAQAPEGSGLLALLQFAVLDLGECTLSLGETRLLDHEGISDDITDLNDGFLTIGHSTRIHGFENRNTTGKTFTISETPQGFRIIPSRGYGGWSAGQLFDPAGRLVREVPYIQGLGWMFQHEKRTSAGRYLFQAMRGGVRNRVLLPCRQK
jgi:hypothetical protein